MMNQMVRLMYPMVVKNILVYSRNIIYHDIYRKNQLFIHEKKYDLTGGATHEHVGNSQDGIDSSFP